VPRGCYWAAVLLFRVGERMREINTMLQTAFPLRLIKMSYPDALSTLSSYSCSSAVDVAGLPPSTHPPRNMT